MLRKKLNRYKNTMKDFLENYTWDENNYSLNTYLLPFIVHVYAVGDIDKYNNM